MSSDFEDNYDYHSDGFASNASGDEDNLGGDSAEFDALDAIVNRPTCKALQDQMDLKESPAWRDVNRIKDVRFNFATFFECLYQCYRDLLFGNVNMRSHFGRFLQHFFDLLDSAELPESYITRVLSLLDSVKLLLPRLETSQRAKGKARMKLLISRLMLFQDDSFSCVWAQCESQAAEIKTLRVRVASLEAELGAVSVSLLSSSSSKFVDAQTPTLAFASGSVENKQIKEDVVKKEKGSRQCSVCGLLFPLAGFSGTQWRKTSDRKCLACTARASPSRPTIELNTSDPLSTARAALIDAPPDSANIASVLASASRLSSSSSNFVDAHTPSQQPSFFVRDGGEKTKHRGSGEDRREAEAGFGVGADTDSRAIAQAHTSAQSAARALTSSPPSASVVTSTLAPSRPTRRNPRRSQRTPSKTLVLRSQDSADQSQAP